MATQDTPKSKQPARAKAGAYGGWDFARDFSSGVFALLNSGKIFPVFMMLVLILMAFVAWLLPSHELAILVHDFFDVLRSSFGFAMGCFVASNLGWFALFRLQRRIYSTEIDRLAQIRSRLTHGQAEMTTLETHSSSIGTQQESYIVPPAVTKAVGKKGGK